MFHALLAFFPPLFYTEEYLVEWLKKDDRSDAVRVLRGGPGYGKSSFSKMFAAKQSRVRRVLYLPLHQLELKNDLAEEIERVCRASYGFKTDPYATEQKLLIIFDGLDELTQQGKVCVELAQQFIGELQKKIGQKNHSETRLQVIITGRDLVVQSNESNFRKQGQILSMLPYCVADEEKEKYEDPCGRLKEDKRESWWKKYGELTGRGYQGMPEELRAEQLDELTAHPILNYLLALSFERGNISFDDDMNVNALYADLIDAIHERAYAGRPHAVVGNIEKTDFFKLLEEIAVSAWHGSGHTATIDSIIARCKGSQLHPLLDRFQSDAKKGLSNLLLSFYFQQSEMTRDGEKTFEFTHKSFSEYLVAKRIVRQLRNSCQHYNNRVDGERTWNADMCLHRWIALCGITSLNHDIARFIRDEMLLMEVEEARNIQRFLCELIQHALERGLPFDTPCLALKEELRQSVNAEQALLVSLSSCAWKTDDISKITWPDDTSACKWLTRMQQQEFEEASFVNFYLNHIDFTGCNLVLMDFSEANLKKTIFSNTRIASSLFFLADFENTQLQNAEVYNSCFDHLSFGGCCFRGTEFQDNKFSSTDCYDCDFNGAVFHRNIFDDSDFRNCNFEKARFSWNILEETGFTRCTFENAQFEDNFMKTVISDMNSIIHPELNPSRKSAPEGED